MNNLFIKTFLGFSFLIVVIALALFLPAGSLSYWQGWTYMAVFAGCITLITLYLMRNDRDLLSRRLKGGPLAERQKSQQIIQSLTSLFYLALFVVPGLDFQFSWSDVPPVISLVSDGFVALGFYIVFLTFKENSYTSATIEVYDEQSVISSGPYRVVRHPMYAGAILLVLFTPPALGSWVALPFTIPLILVIMIRAVDEERFLTRKLPGYEAYRQKVRYRILPYVW